LGHHKYEQPFKYDWKGAWGHHNESLPFTAVQELQKVEIDQNVSQINYD